MPNKLTTEEFVSKAEKVHGLLYTYSEVVLINTKTNIIITCRKHGEFSQRPNHHLSGSGCPKCADEVRNKSNKLDTNGFIERAVKVHKDKYDYSLVKYIDTKSKVVIRCKIHGNFNMNLNNHVGGRQGCPDCGRLNTSSSLLLEEPTILYYVKFNTYNGPLYKIGVTIARRGVIGRFTGSQVPPFEILSEVIYPTGFSAFKEEQRLHLEYKEFQYTGPSILQGGNTELFTQDVLNLDS